MREKYYPTVNETIYYEQEKNGLRVFLLRKPGFRAVCGLLSAKFGSLAGNATIRYNDNDVVLQRGVAHFLEHRLFDNKKGPVVNLFSDLGAFANAFTSYDKTAFYFIGSDNIEKSVDLLLDFTSELNIGEESVRKEKDIIVSELRMIFDAPEAVLYRGILNNLYVNHEIKREIGGSEEEVRNTTLPMLEAAHKAFYHPENEVLVIVGDVNAESLFAFIREKIAQSEKVSARLPYKIPVVNEPLTIHKQYDEAFFDIATPRVVVGFKHPPIDKNLPPREAVRLFIAHEMYLNLLFGDSSPFGEDLYRRGVVASPIATNTTVFPEEGCYFSLIEASTTREKEFIAATKEIVLHPSFTREDFERDKHVRLAAILRNLDDVQEEALYFLDKYFAGTMCFDDYDVVNSLRYEEVLQIAELYKSSAAAVFALRPRKG